LFAKKAAATKSSINKIFTDKKKEIENSVDNEKNKEKFYYDLTPSFVANSIIEIIKNDDDKKDKKNEKDKKDEKGGNLTIDDNDDLIYYENLQYENAKDTKRRIEAIIQMFMDRAQVELKETFVKEVFKIIKRKIYFEMKSFEEVKKSAKLDTDKNFKYVPYDNDGIIFGNFDEIIGYEKAKKEVMEDLTFWIKYPNEYKKRGLKRHIGSVFYGTGGTGKTVTALAFKNELIKKGFNIECVYVKTQELSSGQVSKSSEKIANFFINLRRSKNPILILMDEIDFLCKKRNDQALSTERTTEFLRQLGGFDNSNIYIIGTTNKPESIDEAMLRTGRFSRKYLFDVPNLEEREEFIKKYIMDKDLNLEIKTTKEDMTKVIAKRTNYLTGSDFNQILEDCINLLMRKKENNDEDIITIDELHNIISENAPRNNITIEIKRLRNWGKKRQLKLKNSNNNHMLPDSDLAV